MIKPSKPRKSRDEAFEYLFVDECSQERATAYGAEGWELIAVVYSGLGTRFYFKRAVA